MKILYGFLIVSAVCMGMEEVPLLDLQQSIEAMRVGSHEGKTLKDISREEWRHGERHELHLQNKGLVSIDYFGLYVPKDYEPTHMPLVESKMITKLLLNNNKLQSISFDTLSALANLKELDVSHNQIGKVYGGPYVFPNLEKFIFSHNKAVWGDIGYFFAMFPRLRHLDLSHNEITDLAWSDHRSWYLDESGVFTLPVIDLRNNPITEDTKACDWLKEKYVEQLNKKTSRIFSCGALNSLGGVAGGMSGALPALCVNSCNTGVLLLKILSPLGAAFGCLTVTLAMQKVYSNQMHERIAQINVPIYLNDADNRDDRLSYIDVKSIKHAGTCCVYAFNTC